VPKVVAKSAKPIAPVKSAGAGRTAKPVRSGRMLTQHTGLPPRK
jgi:hypothetical protein